MLLSSRLLPPLCLFFAGVVVDALAPSRMAQQSSATISSRWDALASFGGFGATATAAAAAAVVSSYPSAAGAAGACPKGANNCLTGIWLGAKDAKDAAATLKAVLESYPPAGQAGVDGGGFKFVSSSPESFKLEFYSAGTGNMAKFFNGGKPFVDDLECTINADGSVTYKSASRVGDSDFGVNGKRIAYIADALRAKGWRT